MVCKNTRWVVKALTRSIVPPLAMLAMWFGLLFWWTSGFSAFTTFSSALQAAGPLPRTSPAFEVRDQFGVTHNTREFGGKYVMLQFSYLSCGDVCPLVMGDFHRIHHALANRMPDELLLLTVSFDPLRDSTERLDSMWNHHGQPEGWYLMALTSALDDRIQADLRSLGVWIERRDDGTFNHSAQAFLLDPQGQVVQVFEGPAYAGKVIAAIEERLQ